MRVIVSSEHPRPDPDLVLNPRMRRILATLAAADAPLWTLDIARRSGMPFNTAYPVLRQLIEAGWVQGVIDDTTHRAPARHLYRLHPEAAVRIERGFE